MDFWIDNPKLLFQADHIHEVWMYPNMTTNEKMNALTRLIILLSLIGFLCLNRSVFLVIGAILISLMVLFYKKDTLLEGMEPSLPVLPNNPLNNPLNNVLMNDYKDHPNLKPNHPEYGPEVEKAINTSALSSIFQQNAGNKDIQNGFKSSRDQFEFEQSMRPFLTQSVNTVDQVEYGDFLKFFAGSMPSDKPLNIH